MLTAEYHFSDSAGLKLRSRVFRELLSIQEHGTNVMDGESQFSTLNSFRVTLKFPQGNPEKSSALPIATWVGVAVVLGSGWVQFRLILALGSLLK